MRDGDLELYTMDMESKTCQTHYPLRWDMMAEPGSVPDGQQVIWRASRPKQMGDRRI